MKKFLAIALVAMMLVALGAGLAVSAAADHFYANVFNPEGPAALNGSEGVIYTTTNTTNGWWFQAAFAPNGDNWEVVELKLCDGTAATIPANGFVWALHDTGTVVSHTYIVGMSVGQIYTIEGLDLANLSCDEDATIALVGADDVTSDDVTSDDVTSDEVVYPEWSAFWITHFNDGFVEGAGSVFTAEDTAGGWWIHVAFAPVEGYTNVFEVASISNGLSYGDGAVQAIPEGGFVWAANYGNDYPALGLGEIDYTSAGCNAAIDAAATWTVGQQFVFDGLDLEGLTVPTSTPETAWYDDAYVCTAKIKDFVEGDPDAKLVGAEDDTTDESEKTEDAGDATSMLVFAVIALVAIAGSAVVIKTRK